MSAGSIKRVAHAWLVMRAVQEGIGDREWIALYADLYRQTHGEEVSAEEIAQDAVWRLSLLTEEMYGRGSVDG